MSTSHVPVKDFVLRNRQPCNLLHRECTKPCVFLSENDTDGQHGPESGRFAVQETEK